MYAIPITIKGEFWDYQVDTPRDTKETCVLNQWHTVADEISKRRDRIAKEERCIDRMNKVFRSLFLGGTSFAVAFAAAGAMSSSMLWYRELSIILTPDMAFPIIWAFLYALMGYSAYRS